MTEEGLAQYERIAIDIASRIAEGKINEGQKLSGRTQLSSEYRVSPETIRKAMALLSDMRVVRVKEKSGVTVVSADSARRYLELSRGRGSRRELYDRLQKYLYSYEEAGRKLRDVCRELIEAEQNPLPSEQSFPKFEVTVSEGSPRIGQTIGELRLWQATGATVIAIKRNKNMIISPGPYAELYAGDLIIFVGDKDGALALDRYINRADEA